MLDIEGWLSLACEDGTGVDLTASGKELRAEIGETQTPRRPSVRLVRSSIILARRLSRLLDRNAMTLVVTRRGERIAELGAGVRGIAGARLFGLHRVRVYRRT